MTFHTYSMKLQDIMVNALNSFMSHNESLLVYLHLGTGIGNNPALFFFLKKFMSEQESNRVVTAHSKK